GGPAAARSPRARPPRVRRVPALDPSHKPGMMIRAGARTPGCAWARLHTAGGACGDGAISGRHLPYCLAPTGRIARFLPAPEDRSFPMTRKSLCVVLLATAPALAQKELTGGRPAVGAPP